MIGLLILALAARTAHADDAPAYPPHVVPNTELRVLPRTRPDRFINCTSPCQQVFGSPGEKIAGGLRARRLLGLHDRGGDLWQSFLWEECAGDACRPAPAVKSDVLAWELIECAER